MSNQNSNPIEWEIHFQNNIAKDIVIHPQKESFHKMDHGADNVPVQHQDSLQSLEELVEACQEIKEDCLDALAHQKEIAPEEQVGEVSNNLKSLFNIIVEFTKLMKKFRLREDENKPPIE